MIPIKFKGNIRKTGNSFVVTVPMGIVNLLDHEQEYEFEITKKER